MLLKKNYFKFSQVNERCYIIIHFIKLVKNFDLFTLSYENAVSDTTFLMKHLHIFNSYNPSSRKSTSTATRSLGSDCGSSRILTMASEGGQC